MRPRILSAAQLARIRDVFARAREMRDRYQGELKALPSSEQLATEIGCSVALVRLIGAGHRYANERDVSVDELQPDRGQDQISNSSNEPRESATQLDSSGAA